MSTVLVALTCPSSFMTKLSAGRVHVRRGVLVSLRGSMDHRCARFKERRFTTNFCVPFTVHHNLCFCDLKITLGPYQVALSYSSKS